MHDMQGHTARKSDRQVPKTGLAVISEMPGRRAQDTALMQRIIDDADKHALETLALHYAPRLKSFLMHRGEQSQTAEDIVQDVMIAVWTKAAQFDASKGSFSSWAYRMTRNKWIDHKRKHDRLQPTSPEIIQVMTDGVVASADIDFDKVEAAGAVRTHMAALPNEQKQMLHLAFFEGLSHRQISARTGLPLGTVKGRIRASLKKMRPGLENFQGLDR